MRIVRRLDEAPSRRADPDDDPVVHAAVIGRADLLCTLNRHFYNPTVLEYRRERGVRLRTSPNPDSRRVDFGGMLKELEARLSNQCRLERLMVNAAKSYEEIIDFIAAGTTPETVVAFHPSDSVQQRVAELVERSKDGSISAEDQSELEDYLQLEHIMIMAKARARRHTQLGK